MSIAVERTEDDLKRAIRARRQAPDREYLRRRFPKAYREKTNPETGLLEWRVGGQDASGKPRLSRADQRELNGLLAPFMAAESERGATLRARRPRPERLLDQEGTVRHIHPALARQAAHRNGWRSAERPTGRNPVERGEGGMLWKRLAGSWMPLGVTCLGTDLLGHLRPRARGIQYDPDGRPHRRIHGEWRALA